MASHSTRNKISRGSERKIIRELSVEPGKQFSPICKIYPETAKTVYTKNSVSCKI